MADEKRLGQSVLKEKEKFSGLFSVSKNQDLAQKEELDNDRPSSVPTRPEVPILERTESRKKARKKGGESVYARLPQGWMRRSFEVRSDYVRRLKFTAAEYDMTIKDLLDEALTMLFKKKKLQGEE